MNIFRRDSRNDPPISDYAPAPRRERTASRTDEAPREAPPSFITPSPINPPIRSLSEAAGLAAQHVIELEHRLESKTAELAKLESSYSVMEQSNTILHEELHQLKSENEHLRDRNVEIMTRLQVAARTLLDIASPASPLEDPLHEDPGFVHPHPSTPKDMT